MTELLPPAIFLMGPTASGKTALAEHIAARWPCEVISVDSALVYRGMDIGTAKPDLALQSTLPHRLIDIIEPEQRYSAADFRRDALQHMAEITAAGKVPLLVGGTMLYFKVLLEGMAELPAADHELRAELTAAAERDGWPALHARLAICDPETAANLHPNHSQRILRALEVYLLSGEPMSALQRQQHRALRYRVAQFALWPTERGALHRRIDQRFADMLAGGFLDEMGTLRRRPALTGDAPSMRAVGYRQAWDYLDQGGEYADFVARGQAATRQLAKRQLTWLRKWPGLHRLPIDYAASDSVHSLISPFPTTLPDHSARPVDDRVSECLLTHSDTDIKEHIAVVLQQLGL